MKTLSIISVIILAFGIYFNLVQSGNADSKQLMITTQDNTFRIQEPSFENYIKSEENATMETSINLNVSNARININKGDSINVHADFKLGIAAVINVSLFQGTEAMITDGTSNIQFDGKLIPILKLEGYPEGYDFQVKIPKDIEGGIYKMAISFDHTEGVMYYTPTVIVS